MATSSTEEMAGITVVPIVPILGHENSNDNNEKRVTTPNMSQVSPTQLLPIAAPLIVMDKPQSGNEKSKRGRSLPSNNNDNNSNKENNNSNSNSNTKKNNT